MDLEQKCLQSDEEQFLQGEELNEEKSWQCHEQENSFLYNFQKYKTILLKKIFQWKKSLQFLLF